jgi:hypothetical protein
MNKTLAFVLVLASLLLVAAPGRAQVINTLEYFLTDNENIELNTGNVSDTISQKTYGNMAIRVKWRQPSLHEDYTWDSNYIYLRYDSTWGNHNGATSYEFLTDPGKGGKWMKRSMSVGESITVGDPNGAVSYRDDCSVFEYSGNYYTNTLEAYYPSYNIGGQLGTDEVIVLKYDWGGGVAYERFFYSKKWGWIRWEYWENGVMTSSVLWNRISTRAPVTPQAKCVAFPTACFPLNQSCGHWDCTGRQCFAQPVIPGECQAGYDWCYAGCCCKCT